MQKQTVAERYAITNAKPMKVQPKQQAASEHMSYHEQQAYTISNQLQQVLQETHHVVQQTLQSLPEDQLLASANEKMQYARQLLQQLRTTIPTTSFKLDKLTNQQLTQLSYQIEGAAQTISTIQQAFSRGSS